MPKKQIHKKIIASLILLGVILMPLSSFPKKAEAQNISAYMKGLTPAIAQLPLCVAGSGSGIKGLFMTGGEIQAAQQAEEYADSLSITPSGLEETTDETINQFDSVNTYDVSGNKKLSNIDRKIENVDKKVSSLEANDTCIKSIGRMVIKMLLQKMTLATVDWINNGFNGGPAFVQDPGQFFGDIAKNEILQFGTEINNPDLFPFGRAFMENQARAFQNKFADNARYSLNEMISQTNPDCRDKNGNQVNCDVAFSQDFSQGGWDAWTYMTQVPANNPLGFQIMASNELQKRLEGTEQSTAQNIRESLKASSGFLGDYRCADPGDYITQEEHQKALAERSTSSMGPYQYELCKRWEYVTPGSMVAKAATDAVKYPENSLLKAEDLNDAVAAIIDALINRFSTDLMTKGFAKVTDDIPSGALAGNFIANENNFTSFGINRVAEDYPTYIVEASSWLKQNPSFNIRTDLNQALIDEQRTYVDKVSEQNKELADLITVTRQLDYCIPGPHPGWESDSQARLNETLGKVPSYEDGIDSSVVGTAASVSAKLGQIFPPFGTFSMAYNFFNNLFGSNNGSDQEKYYAAVINGFTGLRPNAGSKTESIQQVSNFLNLILQRYANIIHQVYDQNPYMPLVTNEAANEFLKIPGYQKIISDSVKKATTIKSITARLTNIKNEVDGLNTELRTGALSQDEYNTKLEPLINSFGRMSADMISGDNIANIDNISKQARDKKTYIYNDLLKGPEGCEQDLAAGEAIHLPWQIANTKRMTYPFPILYDYNQLHAGDAIPDPWSSGYTNHMISGQGVYVNTVGPGFLSNTHFSRNDTGTSLLTPSDFSPSQFPYITPAESNHPGTLTLYLDENDNDGNYEHPIDLENNAANVSVGKNICSDSTCTGVFESMIGVY